MNDWFPVAQMDDLLLSEYYVVSVFECDICIFSICCLPTSKYVISYCLNICVLIERVTVLQLTGRQSERELKEAKAEGTQLRNRLVLATHSQHRQL